MYLPEPHDTEAAGTKQMLLAQATVKLEGQWLRAEGHVLGLAIERTVLSI